MNMRDTIDIYYIMNIFKECPVSPRVRGLILLGALMFGLGAFLIDSTPTGQLTSFIHDTDPAYLNINNCQITYYGSSEFRSLILNAAPNIQDCRPGKPSLKLNIFQDDFLNGPDGRYSGFWHSISIATSNNRFNQSSETINHEASHAATGDLMGFWTVECSEPQAFLAEAQSLGITDHQKQLAYIRENLGSLVYIGDTLKVRPYYKAVNDKCILAGKYPLDLLPLNPYPEP